MKILCTYNQNFLPQQGKRSTISADTKNTVSPNFTSAGVISPKAYDAGVAFYNKYYNSLGETKFHKIHQTVKILEKKTQHSKKEILSTMQQLTQFANMRSLQRITEVLNKHEISAIANFRNMAELSADAAIVNKNRPIRYALRDNFGLNSTLEYLIQEKEHGELRGGKNGKIAIFLDEHKVAQLEKAKKKNKKEYQKIISNPKYKFFTLSGFDSGITFANREKSLGKETLKYLNLSDISGLPVEKLIDRPLKNRIKRLGIRPIEIKNEGLPTVNCVYSQMTPEKMTRNDLLNLICVNAEERFPKCSTLNSMELQEKTIGYLKQYCKIYTPENFSKALKDLHTKIVEAVEKKGKTEDDIIYVLDSDTKSYLPVSYFYSKVNNIPNKKFANISSVQNYDNKIFVGLDDCSISGVSAESFVNALEYRRQGKPTDIILAYVCSTKKAGEEIKSKNVTLVYRDRLNSHNNNIEPYMHPYVGKSKYEVRQTSTCLVLPYMSPDNNSELGANMSMLHNHVQKLYRPYHQPEEFQSRGGIKTFSSTTKAVTDELHRRIGSTPEIHYNEKDRVPTFTQIFRRLLGLDN